MTLGFDYQQHKINSFKVSLGNMRSFFQGSQLVRQTSLLPFSVCVTVSGPAADSQDCPVAQGTQLSQKEVDRALHGDFQKTRCNIGGSGTQRRL